jgi:hypothetical protein
VKINLPDIVAAGVYNAEMVAKNKTITKNRKTTMFEIELPLENGGISYINEKNIPITPNLIICSKPGRLRHTKLPYKCYYIHMIIERGELYEELMGMPDFITVNDREKYESIFREISKISENASGTAL